jgi:hypothetical protein
MSGRAKSSTVPFARITFCLGTFLLLLAAPVASARAEGAPPSAAPDPRLQSAYRFERGGWTYVHLEGSAEHIGFQHGYLLASEIADALEAVKLEDTHTSNRDWEFFRKAAHEMLWPKIDAEYQQELTGIVEGLKARGVSVDVDDLVALNAFEELPGYYVPWFNQQEHVAGAPRLASPGNCSAFIATGSYTRDHQIVMAHNNWTSYLVGSRWVMVFDIVPEQGNRILMDGFPGVITSDDDFAVNSAGIMVAETTISQFVGWDPQGKPEFVRSRKALQYANSIDDYARIIRDGNNGGYANDWLIGDRKTGEIGYLELGLKHTPMWRTKDGYFVSSNFARDPALIRDETAGFDPQDASTSPNARHVRWEQLIKQAQGKIDVGMAEGFMADHVDSFDHQENADERSLCGRVDSSARGVKLWEWGAYYPGGAVQGKATDSRMAERMSFQARAGHPCGQDFIARDFLRAHPEYSWEAPLLRDMKSGPWTLFQAGQHQGQ